MRLSPLQITVRPAQFETPTWYLSRLCRANVVDPEYVTGLLTRRDRETAGDHQLGEILAELGGPEPGHWLASHARACRGLASPRGPFVRQRSPRTACLSCTAGEPVSTYDHIRFAFCLKHGRWVGPGASARLQRLGGFDADLHRAERSARRLISNGLVDQELHDLVWRVTRDATYLSGRWPDRLRRAHDTETFTREVDDRIALYPQTVRLLRVLSSDQFAALAPAERSAPAQGRTSGQSRGATRRRSFLHGALHWMTEERAFAVEHIEAWARQRERRPEDGSATKAAA